MENLVLIFIGAINTWALLDLRARIMRLENIALMGGYDGKIKVNA